ncbi:unnamed protein product [Cylicocyclus nassatus]|uniref:Uncharacterized protein n=1 Tax=Cylicocyclus nassatus TaxID=53992 RepID=A0AA36GEA4_CYLNA|nr:unnamed protein product [Cylicocyclus nassatus]
MVMLTILVGIPLLLLVDAHVFDRGIAEMGPIQRQDRLADLLKKGTVYVARTGSSDPNYEAPGVRVVKKYRFTPRLPGLNQPRVKYITLPDDEKLRVARPWTTRILPGTTDGLWPNSLDDTNLERLLNGYVVPLQDFETSSFDLPDGRVVRWANAQDRERMPIDAEPALMQFDENARRNPELYHEWLA